LTAVVVVITAMAGSVVLFIVAGASFATTKAFSRFTLSDTMQKEEGYISSFYKDDLVGKEGIAKTILRPSGKIIIDGELYDAYTRGNYLNKGDKVIVTSAEGTSLKVKLA
ncbi:MAG: NfeD family protein, partial [Bacteroidota bacterium]